MSKGWIVLGGRNGLIVLAASKEGSLSGALVDASTNSDAMGKLAEKSENVLAFAWPLAALEPLAAPCSETMIEVWEGIGFIRFSFKVFPTES